MNAQSQIAVLNSNLHSRWKSSASNHSSTMWKPSCRLLLCAIWWRLSQPATERHALFYSHICNKNPVAVRPSLWYQPCGQHIKQWSTTSPYFTAANLTVNTAERWYPKNYKKAQNLFQILLGFWIVQKENHNPSYTLHFVPYVNVFK